MWGVFTFSTGAATISVLPDSWMGENRKSHKLPLQIFDVGLLNWPNWVGVVAVIVNMVLAASAAFTSAMVYTAPALFFFTYL